MNESLIPVEKSKIIKACDNALEDIRNGRIQRFEAEVAQAMKPRRVWFRMRTRTRAEAETFVNTPPTDFYEGMNWTRTSYKFWNDDVECHAWHLKDVVGVCKGDVAYLTVKDARFINRYL